jgi:curved DNA-binding protein CbpA
MGRVREGDPTDPDVYRILQVDPAAETLVLDAAFRALARRYHPDGEAPDTARMQVLNRAYALVRSPELRRAYNRSRDRLQPVGPGFVGPPATAQPTSASPAQGPFARAAERNGRERPASQTLSFGRYAGWRLVELAKHDPDYLRWLARYSAGIRFREEIALLLPAEPELSRPAKSVG